MKVENIAVKDVVTTSPDETISSVISEMEKNKIHQIPVLENKKLAGMIFLNDIVIEDKDPSVTTVKNLMRKDVPTIESGADEKQAAKTILMTGMRAIPVMKERRLFGIISETDLIRFVDTELHAKDVMTDAITLAEEDNIGKAKFVMRQENISRLPIVDSQGKLIGTIDTLDLSGTVKPKYRMKKTISGPGEKIHLYDIPVKGIMRRPVTIGKEDNISSIIKILESQEEVIVVDKGIPVGIITPKDLLERMIPEGMDSRIHIANLERDDIITKNAIYTNIENLIERLPVEVSDIFIYVHRHKTNGRVKYSLHARIRTEIGLFVFRSFGWDALGCVQELVKKSERSIKNSHEQIINRRKGSKI